ncbi:MAG: putative Ig domain-containing protein, partial [Microbacteriaceae bacterium]|nr:putative Ig domain-containing protein [Microbacteriaceae bacterium]
PYRYDVRASDPDGDPITFRLDQAPAGMAIDAVGRLTWAPGIPNVGVTRVAVTVEDSRGASVTQTFDLAVLADTMAPRVNLFVSANPVDVGRPVTFVVTATDNVGVASLGLTINGSPVPLDGAGRVTLLAQPAGNYAVVARATDAAGLFSTASTTLAVVDRSDTQPPDVDITSPADGAVVSAPVDVVGTASDANLVSYVLAVAPADGSSPFTEFARGTTSVTGGILGRFDPTGLANDTYTIRLTATDVGGNVSTVSQTVEVAGDLKVGNFTLSFTDLSIPVSGVPITLARTYDTLQAGRQDDFGYGWRMEFRDTDLRTSLPPTGQEEYGVYNAFRDGTRVYV